MTEGKRNFNSIFFTIVLYRNLFEDNVTWTALGQRLYLSKITSVQCFVILVSCVLVLLAKKHDPHTKRHTTKKKLKFSTLPFSFVSINSLKLTF
jgi:hypothetical protein